MQPAIICLEPPVPSNDAKDFNEALTGESLHALAIALEMKCRGHEPALICLPDSSLAENALRGGIQVLEYRSSPYAMFRIWRWQRLHRKLFVLAIGESGCRPALRLAQMRKKGDTEINFYFPVIVPTGLKGRVMARASRCLCGSSRIEEIIGGMMEKAKPSLPRPDIRSAMPCLDLGCFQEHSARSCGNFIFGMAESLMPESGALLLVRAMAAVWQHRDIPPWEVRLFGDGPRFEEIMTEAASLGVLPRLSLLSEQLLSEAALRCDVWIAPGRARNEWPQALWAGFATGLPVIASNTDIHRQLVPVPGAALRVSTENPQELARAMLALMRDNRLRERLAGKSAKMRHEISPEAMATRVCQILDIAAFENQTCEGGGNQK